MTPSDFRAARKALGLTQHGLAEALRMGKWGFQSVAKWEKGEVPVPGPVAVAMELMVTQIDNMYAGVRSQRDELQAELAKIKALAETLAGAGSKVADAAYHGEECPMNTTGAHCNCGYDKAFDEWSNALRQYKEAHDV